MLYICTNAEILGMETDDTSGVFPEGEHWEPTNEEIDIAVKAASDVLPSHAEFEINSYFTDWRGGRYSKMDTFGFIASNNDVDPQSDYAAILWLAYDAMRESLEQSLRGWVWDYYSWLEEEGGK